MSRPEGSRPPELYYDDKEARKYDSSSRIINIQAEISERALEMLNLPPADVRPSYILDVGCGSGLSGQAIEEAGHYWVGCDISQSMLTVASERESDAGDLVEADMGQGLPFRPGTFDGVISISAIQWLCYSETSAQDPKLRLNRFFSSLYSILKRDAKAVLQFYPESAEQAVLIAQCASKVGFAGGIVVDYPNSSKAKKFYLCLSFERSYTLPSARTDEQLQHQQLEAAGVEVLGNSGQVPRKRRESHHSKRSAAGFKSHDWIMKKKERQRNLGKTVKTDSKFTGRKRKPGF